MSLVSDQLAKVNPLGPGAAALEAVRQESAAAPQGGGETLAQESARLRAETDAAYADQARLEREHGVLATAGAQGARGLLDAVLASGALAGAAVEGAGALTGSSVLSDFGRGLGEASSGKSAAEAAAFLFGGGGQEGLSASERVTRDLEEQERAHPMLSSVSRVAGQAALALAGGAASAASRAAATVGATALEGAAAGAQGAYEEAAPLRDVLTSALLGAGLGAAGGAGAHYLGSSLASRAASRAASSEESALLTRVFGSVDELAGGGARSAERAGGREAAGVLRELEAARDEVRAAARASSNPAVAAEAASEAAARASRGLAAKAGPYDAARVLDEAPTALQKVVYRKEILDQASSGLSEAVSSASAARPGLDFDIDPAVARRLTRGADAGDAIGGLQAALARAGEEAPATAAGDQMRQYLRAVTGVVDRAEVEGALSEGHVVARHLLAVAEGAPDEASRGFARRAARSVMDELSGDQWGKAGAYYRELTAAPSEAFERMSDPKVLRAALASSEYRGALGQAASAEAKAVALAHDARLRLSGASLPRGERRAVADVLSGLERKFAAAEEATTLDGGAAGKVIDWLKDKVEDKVLGAVGGVAGSVMGGLPGAALGYVVSNAVRPAVRRLVPALVEGVARGAEANAGRLAAAASRASVQAAREAADALTPEERQGQYRRRLDLAFAVQADGPPAAVAAGVARLGLPEGAAAVAAADYREKMSNFLRDVPKPPTSVKGPAWETLSDEQVRLADAMWEATVRPLSVFEDFEAGDVDYDKVQYAWRQYPGLRTAAQAAFVDVVSGMTDEQRGEMPDSVLGQVDFLLGFDGQLDPMLDRAMSQRVDQAFAAEQEQGAQGGGAQLDTGLSEPTFAGRLAGEG